MADNKDKSSMISKLANAGEAFLDAYIHKAKTSMMVDSRSTGPRDDSHADFGKAVINDKYANVSTQGYQEKPGMVGYEFQRLMSIRSSVIAGIIRTRQNRVAAYSKHVKEGNEKGFRIRLKDEETFLNEAMMEMNGGKEVSKLDLNYRVLYRKAKMELEKAVRKDKVFLENIIMHCGEIETQPFEVKKWNFDSFLRAITNDSLVFDQIAVEFVPKEAERVKDSESGKERFNVAYYQPIDASTIRYATADLKNLANNQPMGNYNILYPEDELKVMDAKNVVELDPAKVEANEYKYVQVIKGRIERAFTRDEMSVGIRNQITDIFINGYGLSELEVLVGLVTNHLQTEYYNKSYFQQGFSAKGLLHIKANINKSKLDAIRVQWQHMVSGNRNSFQTPIMSGMEEIQWIPLTQNHSEMEFSLWLNYLIKMICAIYQIDPLEIGFGFKDEGGKGGGLSGDSSKSKLEFSTDKGFVPFMRFLETFINHNIISKWTDKYKFEWVSLAEDDPMQLALLEEKEVKFKRTINELREASGLPPLPYGDNLILDPNYMQMWMQTDPEFQKTKLENTKVQMELQMSLAPDQEQNSNSKPASPKEEPKS